MKIVETNITQWQKVMPNEKNEFIRFWKHTKIEVTKRNDRWEEVVVRDKEWNILYSYSFWAKKELIKREYEVENQRRIYDDWKELDQIMVEWCWYNVDLFDFI